MRTVHDLKTISWSWDAVMDGSKTFELRRNDRNFQVGDWLNLLRYEINPGTGLLVPAPIRIPAVDGMDIMFPAHQVPLLVAVTYILPADTFNAYTSEHTRHRAAVVLHPDYVIMGVRKL